jgi:uncharacterized RDD family membrane protein YckC
MEETQEKSYAGFWIRLGASFIDGVILIAITWPILYFTYGDSYLSEDSPMIMGNVDILVSWVLPIMATILFWLYRAGTPGKLILKLAVVDAETGNNLSISQSVIRYLGYIVSALPLCLGYLWVAWDGKKQAWHDKMAGSVVIKKTGVKNPVEIISELNA